MNISVDPGVQRMQGVQDGAFCMPAAEALAKRLAGL